MMFHKEEKMRKFKIFLSVFLIVVVCSVFAVEVFAATYINLQIGGNISYYSTEIGAKVWGGYVKGNASGVDYSTATAITINGSNNTGSIEANPNTGNVFYVNGEENEFSNILATLGQVSIGSNDYLYIYIFVKNMGDRYVVPNSSIGLSGFSVTEESLYFDVSIVSDPYNIKNSSSSMNYLSTIATHISSGNASAFTSNSSLDLNDVYLKRYKIMPLSETISSVLINVSFMADIDYESDNILTIKQEINSSNTNWTKYGRNAFLSAQATKISSNSLSSLASSLVNQNYSHGQDDYIDAVVYQDIDIVNIDIATGEPIGKLSNPNYTFEWFGGTVTLPANTVLASGRKLTRQESFTVDCYTYYPTFYIRRWVVGNMQWISISDQHFTGSVQIKNWYQATFETTLFDQNGNVSYNSYGIIPRSFASPYTPTTYASSSYLHNYYYPTKSTASGYSNAPTQPQMQAWASNLTKAWENAGKTSVSGHLPNARIAQGENYVVYIFNWLYLVKYANNNAQSMIGLGNVYTYSLYENYGTSISTPAGYTIDSKNGIIYQNGTVVASPGTLTLTCCESEKGGGVIGCYSSGDSYMNSAYMSYGYQYNYTDKTNPSNTIKGLYAQQFLTRTITDSGGTAVRRTLSDGFVGSDGYTSVFCLGQCNPWGNVLEWVFGSVVNGVQVGNSSYEIQLHTTFDEFNYSSNNYYMSSSASTSTSLNEGNYNYVQMSYNLPSTVGYYTTLGTSAVNSGNGLQSLVGVQSEENSAGSNSSGLCDRYYMESASSYVTASFGVLRGGSVNYGAVAGPFCFAVSLTLTDTSSNVGFRLSLTS